MDKLQITNIEREIIYRLCNSALWSDDQTWADNVKEAQMLMDSDTSVARFTDANLYRCIAYCASKISDVDGQIYGLFWFFVAELARRRMVGR